MISSICTYHLKNFLEFCTNHSDSKRYHVACKFELTCTFSMRSRSFGTVWKIYECISHTCERDLRRGSQPKVSSRAIADHISPNMTEDGFVIRPRDIQGQVLREFGVNLKYSTALAGRNRALKLMYGDQENSFQVSHHPDYLHIVPVFHIIHILCKIKMVRMVRFFPICFMT